MLHVSLSHGCISTNVSFCCDELDSDFGGTAVCFCVQLVNIVRYVSITYPMESRTWLRPGRVKYSTVVCYWFSETVSKITKTYFLCWNLGICWTSMVMVRITENYQQLSVSPTYMDCWCWYCECYRCEWKLLSWQWKKLQLSSISPENILVSPFRSCVAENSALLTYIGMFFNMWNTIHLFYLSLCKHTSLSTGEDLFYSVYFWNRSVVCVALPCVLLIFLNIELLRGIRQAELRRLRLLR